MGGEFRFYSVTVWKLGLTGENEVLVNAETNHWLNEFSNFLIFIYFILFIFLAPKSGGAKAPSAYPSRGPC